MEIGSVCNEWLQIESELERLEIQYSNSRLHEIETGKPHKDCVTATR